MFQLGRKQGQELLPTGLRKLNFLSQELDKTDFKLFLKRHASSKATKYKVNKSDHIFSLSPSHKSLLGSKISLFNPRVLILLLFQRELK